MFYFVYKSPIDINFGIIKSTVCFCKRVYHDKFPMLCTTPANSFAISKVKLHCRLQFFLICLEFVIHNTLYVMYMKIMHFLCFIFVVCLFFEVFFFFFFLVGFFFFGNTLYSFLHYRNFCLTYPIRYSILLCFYVYIHNDML